MNDRSTLTIFPDTNVLVQGRGLKDQPWKELGRDEIEVILCGPVIRELDRLKTRPGRVGKVARAISTKVRELMRTADRSELICEADPRVVLRLAQGMPNQAAVREGIDLSHDDQAIINQALASLDAGADVALLTDDNFAAMTAEHFGLPVQLLPTHWLKEPEPDDSAKEIARRDAEIARLKSAEPALELRFVDRSDAPIERLEVTMRRYQPVAPTDVDRLVERVTALAPMVEVVVDPGKVAPPSPGTGRGFDIASIAYSPLGKLPVTKADIEKYEGEYRSWLAGVRSKIAGFHVEWNRRREWPEAILYASNKGSRPAEDVLVEISASGAFQLSGPRTANDKPHAKQADWLQLTLPPVPPKPKSRSELLLASGLLPHDPLPVLPRAHFPAVGELRRNDDEFYWRDGKSDPTVTIALECKSWRHSRGEEDFPFQVWADDRTEVRGLIAGRISASNIREPMEKHLPLRIGFEDYDCLTMATTLVDDFEQRLASRNASSAGNAGRRSRPDALS